MQVHRLLSNLPGPQQHLLHLIWSPMRDYGQWPIWHYVEDEMHRAGFPNAENDLRSMPMVGLLNASQPHYSLVWYPDRNLQQDSKVMLTIAAGLHLPEYLEVGNNFIVGLRAIVRKAELHEASPFEVTDPEFTSAELAQANVHFTEEFIRAFPGLVHYEPFGLTSRAWLAPDSDNWTMTLKRRVLREYAGITTVEEYVRKVVELVERHVVSAAPMTPQSGGVATLNQVTAPVNGTSLQVGAVHGDVNIHQVAQPDDKSR